jgi:hypothetical protein
MIQASQVTGVRKNMSLKEISNFSKSQIEVIGE